MRLFFSALPAAVAFSKAAGVSQKLDDAVRMQPLEEQGNASEARPQSSLPMVPYAVAANGDARLVEEREARLEVGDPPEKAEKVLITVTSTGDAVTEDEVRGNMAKGPIPTAAPWAPVEKSFAELKDTLHGAGRAATAPWTAGIWAPEGSFAEKARASLSVPELAAIVICLFVSVFLAICCFNEWGRVAVGGVSERGASDPKSRETAEERRARLHWEELCASGEYKLSPIIAEGATVLYKDRPHFVLFVVPRDGSSDLRDEWGAVTYGVSREEVVVAQLPETWDEWKEALPDHVVSPVILEGVTVVLFEALYFVEALDEEHGRARIRDEHGKKREIEIDKLDLAV